MRVYSDRPSLRLVEVGDQLTLTLIYDFDTTATSPVLPEVLDVYVGLLGESGNNPASSHAGGLRALARLDEAKRMISRCLDCSVDEIIFTSGGTESINLALLGTVAAMGRRPKLSLIHIFRDTILPLEEVARKLLVRLRRDYSDETVARYGEADGDEASDFDSCAVRMGCILGEGVPDTARFSSMLLDDFRAGRIGRITLEWPPSSDSMECPDDAEGTSD